MIKKLPFLAFTLFVVFATAQQQPPFLQWEKLYGGNNSDEASSVQQTTDGGYIVAGLTLSNNRDVSGNHGSNDGWVTKLNSDGALQWQKALGGSSGDEANSILQTTDGGYIVAGYTNSNDGDVSGNHGNGDAWIVKLDAAGGIQWQKTYGSSGYDVAKSIQQTTDGSYIFVGESSANDGDVSGNHGGSDCWIVKINATGNIQWQKSYGGSGADRGNSIQQTADGGYVVAAVAASNDGDITRFQGVYDYWIIKLNSNGNLQWQKSYGGTNFDWATNILQTKGGGYIIVGSSASGDGDVTGYHTGVGCSCYTDYWVVKLYPDGGLDWEKSLGGFYDDVPGTVLQTDDGNFVVAGWAYYAGGDIKFSHGLTDFWLVKLDKGGKIIWEKTYGQTRFDQASGMAQTTDKGFIVAGWKGDVEGGEAKSNINRGGSDFAVMKISPDVLDGTITTIDSATTANCSAKNSISDTIGALEPSTVRLYRYGQIYDSATNVIGHVTFNNLLPGTYYATATINGVISTSSATDILPVPVSTGVTDITSTSGRLNWQALDCADDFTIKYKVKGTTEWTQKTTAGNVNTYNLFDLLPSTKYVAKIASNKSKNFVNGTSKFSDSIVFTTSASFATNYNADNASSVNIGTAQLTVSPNPAKNFFVINYKDDAQQKINATLYNATGKAIWSSGLINTSDLNGKQVNASQFAKGIFYLKVTSEKGKTLGAVKVVIAK